MGIEQLIEQDLIEALEVCFSIGTYKSLETVQKVLEQTKPTFSLYKEYFDRWENAQHKIKYENN